LGAGIATGLLNVALHIGDKISFELKRYGANLILLPQEDALPLEVAGVNFTPAPANSALDENALPRLKEIFWRHNILGFVPELQAPVAIMRAGHAPEKATLVGTWFDHPLPLPEQTEFRTGLRHVVNYWQVSGQWASDEARRGAMIGLELAKRLQLAPGDSMQLEINHRREIFFIRGVVTTGGPEEQQIFAPLAAVQALADQPGKVKKILVSALTNPEDDFSRKPFERMSREEYDRWYCTPYVSSIAHQLREAMPGSEARIIRQVTEGEGAILRKISLLMFLITLAIFFTSILGVMSTMTTIVLERRKEVGLLRALGAESHQISSIFLGEALLMGLCGGILGSILGYTIALQISQQIFDAALPFNSLSLPVAVAIAMLIAIIGSLLPLRKAFAFDPVVTLHGA
jgi:putative ABC transport system permease protein